MRQIKIQERKFHWYGVTSVFETITLYAQRDRL
jgi:hypothetical protein